MNRSLVQILLATPRSLSSLGSLSSLSTLDSLRALTTLILLVLFSAAQAQPPATDDDSTVTYQASFFDQFAPVSVKDMLDRIPGIGLVLNTNRGALGNDSARGLGGSEQILIDGKRLAGKANEAESQLARIAATEVDRIEIIRGSSSQLDVQNSGQIVNIVLKSAPIRISRSAEVGFLSYRDGHVEPEASLAVTGQRGALNYQISASARSGYNTDQSFELSLHPGLQINEIVEFEREREQSTYAVNSNLTYDLTRNDRIAFNALYRESDPPSNVLRTITDFNGTAPVSRYERERIPATSDNWELGGDYEHSFVNGSKYKILFILNENNNETTRERWQFAAPGAPETKNLFLANSSRYQEKIVRTSYTWNLRQDQGLELGIEIADTVQDTDLKLGQRLPGPGAASHGGLTPIPLPNAFSTVQEVRYEGFAVHNWRISPRMTLESSLVAEISEIEQTGDIYNKRDFDFLKPKFDFRFDINTSMQLRASVEKVVSQLSFADFSAATNNRDEDQNTIAGNPELEQEESWRYTLNLDYRLPNDGGVLNSRIFYHDVDNAIGKIDISRSPGPLASTNGNVGSGTILGLNLDASIRFGFIGFPQALLTGGLLVQESRIDDPLIGFERKIVPFDRGSWRIGFRQDVARYALNYGFTYTDRFDGNRPFYDIDNVLFIGSGSDFTAFLEKSAFGGLTFRLEARNILDHENKQERRRYNGYLRDASLREIERFSVTNGAVVALKVRGTF